MGDYEAEVVTKEQLKYLELRRKLKEHYRKQFKKETSSDESKKDDKFGSFFGPSQPTIVPRVIHETTSLLQFEVLRKSNPRYGENKAVGDQGCAAGIRLSNVGSKPKVDAVKVKLQKMKYARDYCFLFSEDAQPQKVSAKKADNPTQIAGKGTKVLEQRKPVSQNGKMQCFRRRDAKADSTATRRNPVSSGLGNCNRAAGLERQTGSKNITGNAKKTVTVKMVAKQAVTYVNPHTSRPTNKPIAKHISSLHDRPKKRPLAQQDPENDGGFEYISEIRNIFKYNPDKYIDDDDTRGMEAGFHDILKEERRSALIARKEDQIEQKKIEDEARKEKMKKNAKRRKLSQS